MMTRRELLAAASAAAVLPLHADPLGMPIGTQTYPLREKIGKDFAGTLREIAGLGYKTIEMCSPAGYANAGYGPLVNVKAAEIRSMIHDAGLRCESCHFNFGELRQHLDERIAWAKEMGLTQMVCSTFGVPATGTLDDWTRAASELNKHAEQIQKAGMQTGFHNHDGEFKEIDGTLVYDRLMSTLDPKLVKMQFQVSVVHLGFEGAPLMKKHKGRFLSMHLQDWSKTENKTVAVGSGMVDWKALFAAAKTAGVKNYFVELPWDAMGPSYKYLHAM